MPVLGLSTILRSRPPTTAIKANALPRAAHRSAEGAAPRATSPLIVPELAAQRAWWYVPSPHLKEPTLACVFGMLRAVE